MANSLKHRLEYGAVWFWGGLFRVLPYRAALAVGWGVAWFGHFVVRYRVGLVYGRIREVFPDADDRRVRWIAWRSWRNFVFNVVDMFRLARIDADWIEQHVIGAPELEAAMRAQVGDGRGGVSVSLHMGSAEVTPVCLQKMGFDLFVIQGRQKNLLVDQYLADLRTQTGITVISKDSLMIKQVFRRLRSGGLLLMLADLRMPTGGVEVDFLGSRAHVVGGMGVFAKRCQVPLMSGMMQREGWTRHRVQVFETLHPREDLDDETDVQRMTQAVFDHFSAAIRAHPEQWFWYNKNWVLAPLRQTAQTGEEAQDVATGI